MIIAIDILHIAYWNFYKNIIKKLEKDNHCVYLFIRERGPLLKVIKKEYDDHSKIVVTGKYYNGRKKLILHLLRIPKLIFYLYKFKIDVVSSDGFFIGVAAKFKNIPAILHSDDFEYAFSYKMTQLFSSSMIIPDVFPITSRKDIHYKGCKEYAYLNKKYFIPNKTVASKYIIPDSQYIFIRVISKSSLNYRNSANIDEDINSIISYFEKKNIIVLISSEYVFKTQHNNCIILEPPIDGFHSLLYFAKIVITEGDTMAREAAVLGTPVIYLGGRKMKIHNYFNIKKTFIESKSTQKSIIEILENLMCIESNNKDQITFDDINEIMCNHIIALK